MKNRYVDMSKLKIKEIEKWVQYFKNLPNFNIKRKLRVATVFSGIGAIEQALERCNIPYEIVFACDNDKFVKESYFANYDIDERKWFNDITEFRGCDFKNVDLIVGGSPCQSFSSVGKRKGLNDNRGNLIFDYIRLIKDMNPSVFIFENVKGLTTMDKGKVWKDLVYPEFSSTNYSLFYQVLNSVHYGIPQNRNRLFLVGFREKVKDFTFPAPVPLTLKVPDLLLDHADESLYLSVKGRKFVSSEKQQKMSSTQVNGDIALCQRANQQFNWHGDFILDPKEPLAEKYFLSEAVKSYVLSSGTKNFKSNPKTNLDIARPLLSSMASMHRAGVDNYFEYDEKIRKLSPRECLRLMGFSDNFKQVVSNTQMYKQSGNSMVVDVIAHLLSSIEPYFKK